MYPLLFNHIYGMLEDATDGLWCEKWKDGYKETITAHPWNGGAITKTEISCENIGTVETKGGVLETWPGRKFEAIGLTDGYAAGAEYTYAEDKDGQVYIFVDKLGVKKKLEDITYYESVLGEAAEKDLWQQGKHDESRLRHDINNFNLFVHSFTRNDRSWCAPERNTAKKKLKIKILETLGENGEIPTAWLGLYADCFLVGAASMMECGDTEEGYEYLERALELFTKWDKIPEDELLDTGNRFIFGGIKVFKGKNTILLPDGTKEPNVYDHWIFGFNGERMFYALTALHGWEWFNKVREEERFKEMIEKAKKLIKN